MLSKHFLIIQKQFLGLFFLGDLLLTLTKHSN